MRRGLGVFLGAALAASATLVPLAVQVATAPPAAAAAPTPTPARTGVPANIYAIGDSITTATGTGRLGAETPANSWVTGTNGSVNSMRARLGISAAVTLATNGRRMQDFDDQANSLPASAQYVVVELGGNDLCRPSVAEMTSEASYRAEVRNGLAAVASHAPNALIFVASVPDVYNLWYLRGAPQSVNPYVHDPPDQDSEAHLFWDNGLVDIIPCKSLLDQPTSTAPADENRRQQVRARNVAFNRILAEECGAVLRCRTDGGAFFDRSSNRMNPPNGPLLPHDQWWFRNTDISHNTGIGCPVSGTFAAGCGDHFHPSLSGQAKLAQGGHEASYQFQADGTAPTVTTTPDRGPDGNGVYAHSVQVSFGGSDANGIRGQEVRVYGDGQTPGPWQQHIGLAPAVTVSATGITHVEARSLDDNGNLSASTLRTITVDPSQFGAVAGTVSGPSGPLSGIQVTLHAAGAQAVLRTTTTAANGTYAFADILASDNVKVRADDLTGVHIDEWYDNAATHAAATVIDVPAEASVTRDLTLALTPGTVAGTVTGPGGLSGIQVDLHAAGSPGVVASTTTGVGGAYTLDVVPGSYKVQFTDPTGDHLTEWFDDQSGHGTASTVAVTRSVTTTANAVLTLTPGALGGTVSDSGGPLSGVTVDLHAAGSPGVIATATTDGSGHYGFPLVTPGAYRVHFSDPSGDHLGEWHSNAATHAAATSVAVAKTDTATVDALLALTPGAVAGTVTDADGGPLQGIEVVVQPSGSSATTDANGDYEITGLAPGPHPLATTAVPCTWLSDSADAVVPTAGGVDDDVDFTVAEEPPGPHGLTGVPAWVDESVRWLVDDCNDPRYMTGLPDGSFGATADISRGQVLRAIWRIEGEPDPQIGPPHLLTDIPAWIAPAVDWALSYEYMTGFSDDTFRADAPISRAQIARLLFRLAGSPMPQDEPHHLSDVPAWVEQAVRWMLAEGHASGIGGAFLPERSARRAEFASWAFRIYG